MSDYAEDRLTQRVIACIITVHQKLGPGFLEYIYERAMMIELARNGLHVDQQRRVDIFYDGHHIGTHCIDLIVEQQLIVELKAVHDFAVRHYAQTRSYLKATGLRTALLVNFSGAKAEFRRVEL